MGKRAVRIGMTLWLAGCFCHAVCQSVDSAAQPERAGFGVYESFFHQVWQQRDVPKDAPVLLNGQPTNLKLPNVRDDVGLTDPEMQVLREIAADCEAKTESLDRISRPLTFEYLLESIESGQDTSGPLRQRLQELADQREQVVRDHVERLKMALGDSRFEKLDAFVRNPIPGAPRKAGIRR